ncbi:MAG TPA: alpha/beta hydrolase [Candidatus Nanopelagicales bacterium]
MSALEDLRNLAGRLPGESGRFAGAIGAAGAALTVGAALGVAAERALVRRGSAHEDEADRELGTLRGRVVPVVASDGVPLHVEVEEARGSAARAGAADLTVVFSHGFALSQDTWHYQRRDLRSLGRLVFWDQRSHGRSGRSAAESDTIDQLGKDLAAVIDATCPPAGPVVLVGHSMGGMTVMAYAELRPEDFGSRVRGAALIATSAGGLTTDVLLGLPPSLSRGLWRLAPGVVGGLVRQKEIVERTRQMGSDLGLVVTRRYSFGSSVSPALAEFVHDMIWATPIEVVGDFLPTLDTHDKRAAIQALQRVDTVVMVGDKDLMTPPSHSEAIVEQLPGVELVRIPGSGHMVMLERYPDVNDQLRALVARVRHDLGPTG